MKNGRNEKTGKCSNKPGKGGKWGFVGGGRKYLPFFVTLEIWEMGFDWAFFIFRLELFRKI
ncbi:MAG: hypothetical protein FWE91_12605 [Defluviitaleaceae bacterium]|nr:hypothetical protein [Defluviitaleaceae bacterium]MCL2836689.1 hypothetical protein [Defluviitaleaceae bacterium]